jgi:DNA topoisomerase-2
MDSLRVDIDVAECCISIYYNAQGVRIELHPEVGVYMPEMVFGDLSNYEEIAGMRNSYGVNLANLGPYFYQIIINKPQIILTNS